MNKSVDCQVAKNNSCLFTLESLCWESDFFGLKTAKLSIATEDEIKQNHDNSQASFAPYETLSLNDFDLLQCKIPMYRTDLLDSLSSYGFQLVEGEIDLAFDLSGLNKLEKDTSLLDQTIEPQVFTGASKAEAQQISELRNIATQVFSASRFRAPWYHISDSGRFYAEWIEKAVLGTFDHCCLVVNFVETGELAGFVTLRRLGAQEARIGLLAAVPSNNQNKPKGIGKALIDAAKSWCIDEGVSTLRIATQSSNLPALKRYIHEGANIQTTSYWMYKKQTV